MTLVVDRDVKPITITNKIKATKIIDFLTHSSSFGNEVHGIRQADRACEVKVWGIPWTEVTNDDE